MSRRRPKLTPVVVADNSALGAAIDELFTGNDNYRKFTAKILRAQARLRKTSTEEGFQIYLDIEATVNARMNFMLTEVARWAFQEGRRQRHGKR